MLMALIRLTRPYYSVPLSGGLIVITAYSVGGDLGAINNSLAVAVCSLWLIISAGYVLNDVCDMPVDAINSPNRVLPKGTITRRAAGIFSIGLFLAGIALASFCGGRFFAMLALVAAGLVVYDLCSKRLGLFKSVLVAALATSLYPLSFALAQPDGSLRARSLFIFPVWLFLTALAYEMLKDIRDIQGDSLLANNRYGDFCRSRGFLLSARVIALAASGLTALPLILGHCRVIYGASSLLAMALVILSLKHPPVRAIRFIYAEVVVITAGSMADLWVYGS
jgi:4-hydroxybenzoate polyprenyltransferase